MLTKFAFTVMKRLNGLYPKMCLPYMIFRVAILLLLSLVKVFIGAGRVFKYGLLFFKLTHMSLLFVVGKLRTVKKLETATKFLNVFKSSKSTPQEVINAGEKLILLLYGASEKANLNMYR